MTPKELNALAKVCRRHGITSLQMSGTNDVKVTFDPYVSLKPTNKAQAPSPDELETDEMTPEQVLLWSATPHELPE